MSLIATGDTVITDRELLTALTAVTGPVSTLVRRPFAYASSTPIDEVDVTLSSGARLALLLKNSAGSVRPLSAGYPRHEVAMYRRVLAHAGLGTACCVVAADSWMLLERVDGVPLWQIGEVDTWCAAARWYARAHARLGRVALPLTAVTRDAAWYARRLGRAVAAHPHLARTPGFFGGYAQAVRLLLDAPQTLVHGEAYPANILVADATAATGRFSGAAGTAALRPAARICAVDWETAGRGPAVLDLAALVAGWDGPAAGRILDAYAPGIAGSPLLAAARLVLAVQWLGWPQPPAAPGAGSGSTDWEAEAFDAARTVRGAHAVAAGVRVGASR